METSRGNITVSGTRAETVPDRHVAAIHTGLRWAIVHRASRLARARRFQLFRRMIAMLPRPISILDVGGTTEFWVQHGCAGDYSLRITLVNLTPQDRRFDNIEAQVGDATDLREFKNRAFDVVFSNSVIEHLSTFDNQRAMAREVRRVGCGYWVQTPNYWCPIEPHFHFIGWQWLPEIVRVAILRRRDCGWRQRTPDVEHARALVREIRLLKRGELLRLFPDAHIVPERVLGLTKSWIVVGGSLLKLPGQSPTPHG